MNLWRTYANTNSVPGDRVFKATAPFTIDLTHDAELGAPRLLV